MSPQTRPIRKIALYEPKSDHVHVYSAFPFPRLGGILLATILRQQGYDCTLYAEETGKVSLGELLEADLVGVSTITPTALRGYAMADEVRKAGVPVVLGGIHPTFNADESLEHADYVIRGEGELSFPALVKALEGGADLSVIPGLSYRREGAVVHNPTGSYLADLDALPFPDYSCLAKKNRWSMVSVMTSRGCPHGCTFCAVPSYFGRKYRTMSVERVLDEIRFQKKCHGKIRYLFFADDIFNLDKNRTKAILEGMLRFDRVPPWGAQVRHEASRDPELLTLMRRSNCDRVFVGFESINPETLKRFNKRESVEQIEQAVRAFHEHKVKVHGMFVIGAESDSVDTIRETRRLARRWGIDTVQFLVLTPIPGSKDYEGHVKSRRLLTRSWNLYDGHHAVFAPEGMTAYELEYETMTAMRRFYSRTAMLGWLIRRDWAEMLVYRSARNLLKRQHIENSERLRRLKEELMSHGERFTSIKAKGASLRKIAIARTGDPQFLRFLETFFRALGVKIETLGKDIQERYAEQSTRMLNTGSRAGRTLHRAVESLTGKVDFLLVPVVKEAGALSHELRAEIEHAYQNVKQGLSSAVPMVKLRADLPKAQLRSDLLLCAFAFTDNLHVIHKAYTKALQTLG